MHAYINKARRKQKQKHETNNKRMLYLWYMAKIAEYLYIQTHNEIIPKPAAMSTTTHKYVCTQQ